MVLSEFRIDCKKPAFTLIDQNECFRLVNRDLATKLRSDGTARPGYKDAFPFKEPSEGFGIQSERNSLEQILRCKASHLTEAHPPVIDFPQVRHRFHCDVMALQRFNKLMHDPTICGRDRNDHLLGFRPGNDVLQFTSRS